jgi:hypothetical protein
MQDHQDIAAIQAEIYKTLDALEKGVGGYAVAKQVAEHDSDRRKAALSRAVSPLIIGGTATGAAEHMGRTAQSYQTDMRIIGEQYTKAQEIIQRQSVLFSKLDALRSILSTAKILAKEIDA